MNDYSREVYSWFAERMKRDGNTVDTQIIKITEELGEAAQALIALRRLNPRKEVVGSMHDRETALGLELLDVALTALVGFSMQFPNINAIGALELHSEKRRQRQLDKDGGNVVHNEQCRLDAGHPGPCWPGSVMRKSIIVQIPQQPPSLEVPVVYGKDGDPVYTAMPGNRQEVYERLHSAISSWLMHTPVMRQSSTSLARHLMNTLEMADDNPHHSNLKIAPDDPDWLRAQFETEGR